MIGILTDAFEERKANIAKAIIHQPESQDLVYDLIKGANPEQKRKVKKVMDEWKAGTLHSGSKKGAKVTNYRQALAIAMSESGLAKSIKKDMDEDGDGEASGGNFSMSEKGMDKQTKLCKHGLNPSQCDDCMEKDLGGGEDFGESVDKGHGGEGSKGGKVVGHTKSGKPIYEKLGANHSHYKDFSSDEHKEASKVHEKLRSKNYNDWHSVAHAKDHLYQKQYEHHKKLQREHAAKSEEKPNHISALEKYHEEDPEKFFEVVSKHYEPEDDGESESKMFENLAKHPKVAKIVEQLHKKFKKGMKDELEKAVENLLGVQDPIEKAFSNILTKGGKGSNKAGRVIGTTTSGKNVHVFKEANDYSDFEPIDHLEAHKIHLHHAHKVSGVHSINSRIRAHSHEDQALIKQAKMDNEKLHQENEKLEKKNQMKKNPAGGAAKKPAAKKTPAAKMKKAWDTYFGKDKVTKAFDDVLQKGEISSSMSSYGDKQPLTFTKTGKQISAKLLVTAVILSEKEALYTKEMSDIEEEIGTAPDRIDDSYNVKTVQVPRYSYDFYNFKSETPNSYGYCSYLDQKDYSDDQKTCNQLCSKYNDLSYKLMSALEDLHAIRIITENIEPNKKYPLSVGQLTSLGF